MDEGTEIRLSFIPLTYVFFSVLEDSVDIFSQDRYSFENLKLKVVSPDGIETKDVGAAYLDLNSLRFSDSSGRNVIGFVVFPSNRYTNEMEILFDYGNGDLDTLVISNAIQFEKSSVSILNEESEVIFNGKDVFTLDFANTNIGDILWQQNTHSPTQGNYNDIEFDQPFIIELNK